MGHGRRYEPMLQKTFSRKRDWWKRRRGAALTPLGKKVIEIYRDMEKKASQATQEEWKSLKKHLK